MGNAKKTAKKFLAVFSSAALLLSCGATGFVQSFAQTGITANAATSAKATKLKVLDENGKDLGDNPILYMDNSAAAGGNVSRSISVVASNDSGTAVDDEIQCFADGNAGDHIVLSAPANSRERIDATIAGGKYTGTGEDRKWESKKPGTTKLYFTTGSGEVYRTVTVVVYQPGTDMKVYQTVGSKKEQFDLNDFNESNSGYTMVIANHQYQFTADKVPSNSTDTVEWFVYDGDGKDKKATSKAEITDKGLFTPKSNGGVTIVAKYKATETSERIAAIGDKKVKRYEDGKEVTKTLQLQNIPKYIHVTIVKENPATSLKINNGPGAMEVGDTLQLEYSASLAHSPSEEGYATEATDNFRWESSNPSVITVDDKGLITAVGKGEATVTLYGENENVHAQANIKVLTKATSIRFSAQTTSTRVETETSITALLSPDTADEEVEWSSSDPSIATVRSTVEGAFTNQQTAAIKGLKEGTVIITARAKNSGVEAKITCTVKPKKTSNDVKLTYQKGTEIVNLYEGATITVFDQQKLTIDGTLVAADGSTPDDTLTWTVLGNGTNNGDYVTIDGTTSNSITLTGFARGTVQVRAASKNNSSINMTINVKILKKATKGNIINAATGLTKFNKYMNVGSSIQLGGDIFIETNQKYDHDDTVARWTSSNESVAVIDNTGFVRVVGNGKAKITMYTESGYYLSTEITGFTTSSVVVGGVTATSSGSLPTASISLDKNMKGTKKLTATVKNEKDTTVSDVAVIWSSSNEEVATVDENGVVTGHKIGEAVITVKSGNKTDSCIVSVDYGLGNAEIKLGEVMYSPFVTSYEPELTVSYQETYTDLFGMSHSDTIVLEEGKDYTLEFKNNTKVGQKASVTITGLGSYESVVTKTFDIVARPINDKEVTLNPISAQELTMSNKSGVKPKISIDQKGSALVEGTDYTVSFTDNKKPGKATVTVTGKGNYSGKSTTSFEIFCKHGDTTDKVTKAATCKATGIKQTTCNICGHKDETVLPLGDHKFVKGKVVAPTYTANGYTEYKCSVCGEIEKRDFTPALSRTSITKCTITTDKTSFNSNGSVQKPKITIKKGSTTLKENTDYTLTYSNKSSSAVGSYTVKIAGINGYYGTSTVSYKILAVAKTIKLDKASTTLGVNESITLKATTDPAAAASNATWKSSNAAVVTVSKGKITAKKAGSATITVTSGKVSATCKVTVKAAPSKVSLTKTAITLGVGETYSLGSSIPANTAAATRTYSSSNGSVVKMTKTSWTGQFKAMKVGTAKVTVKLYNGKTASCTVTVKKAPTKVTLTKTSVTLGVGESFSLGSSIPSGTAAAKRTYSSSNKSVVKMTKTDWTGNFTAVKVGTAKVTVKLYNGKTASCTVTVKKAPASVKLNKGNLTLKVGQTASVSAVLPTGTAAAKRTYRSSNSSVVKMTKTDWTGTFKAMKPGTAYVTVQLYNGKKASIKVTVKK